MSGYLEIVLEPLQRRPLARCVETLKTGSKQIVVLDSPGFGFSQKRMSLRGPTLSIVSRAVAFTLLSPSTPSVGRVGDLDMAV
ncbi:MAG TPA: hypothetical protein VFJ64_10480 [Solirubrobacterales bacterium]|nr:hypothetical protein [Solirubrobacterales bacterium]